MATRCGDYKTQESVEIKGINIRLDTEIGAKTIDFIGRDDGNIQPMEIKNGEDTETTKARVVCYAGNEGKGIGKDNYIQLAFNPEFKVLERHNKNKFNLKAFIYDGSRKLDEIPRIATTEGDRIQIDKPFEFYIPDQVFCSNNMKIVFYAYLKDENKKMEVGIYSFTLYITWRKPGTGYENPMTTIDERMYYYSCTQAAGMGEASEEAVIKALWKKFQIDEDQPTGNLRIKDFDPREDDTQLSYYRVPDPEGGTKALFENKTADCGTFVQLFMETLFVLGIFSSMHGINKTREEKILIKNWKFIGEGTSRDKEYPYYNIYKSKEGDERNEHYRDIATGAYLFESDQEVIKEDGLAGQGNPNPIADFDSHWIAKVNNQYHDPSYGKVFKDFEKWCEMAVAGFFKRMNRGAKQALYFRKRESNDLTIN